MTTSSAQPAAQTPPAPVSKSSATAPQLTFSRETFAKLSPGPYLLAHLQPSLANTDSNTATGSTKASPVRRPNGRQTTEFRAPHVNTGSLTHTEGSAVVRIGDTTAVCGIRGEILSVADLPGGWRDDRGTKGINIEELCLLVPNVELATGCHPAFLPGQPPSVLAQTLSVRLHRLLLGSGVVEGEQLAIWFTPPAAVDEMDVDEEEDEGREGDKAEPVIKAFWTLYIDILFISFDGNAFDATSAACLAALSDVRLPYAYWDANLEMVVCEDDVARSKKLDLRGKLPIACTFAVFQDRRSRRGDEGDKRQWILADPDAFEEGLCDECVTVVVDCSGSRSRRGEKENNSKAATTVLEISKTGGTGVGREEMRELVRLSEKRWGEWKRVLTFTNTDGTTSTSMMEET